MLDIKNGLQLFKNDLDGYCYMDEERYANHVTVDSQKLLSVIFL